MMNESELVKKDNKINKEYFIRVLESLGEDNGYEVSFMFKKENYQKELEELRSKEMYPTAILYSKDEMIINDDYCVKVQRLGTKNTIIESEILITDTSFVLMSDVLEEKEEALLEFKLNNDYTHRQNEIVDVRVYNVSQGNMNSIHYQNDEIVLFDQGAKDKASLNRISPYNFDYSKVSTIIISHFHTDHYNLLHQSNFNNLREIIIPNDVMITNFEKLLDNFMINIPNMKVKIIPLSNTKGTIISHGQYKGLTFFSGNITGNVNNRGIFLNISTCKRSYNSHAKSLTGDIEWDLYTQSLKSYHYGELSIVVPHHGGNIGNARQSIDRYRTLNAIYSCDDGRSYGHPLVSTKNKIKSEGFNELFTNNLDIYKYYKL